MRFYETQEEEGHVTARAIFFSNSTCRSASEFAPVTRATSVARCCSSFLFHRSDQRQEEFFPSFFFFIPSARLACQLVNTNFFQSESNCYFPTSWQAPEIAFAASFFKCFLPQNRLLPSCSSVGVQEAFWLLLSCFQITWRAPRTFCCSSDVSARGSWSYQSTATFTSRNFLIRPPIHEGFDSTDSRRRTLFSRWNRLTFHRSELFWTVTTVSGV